MVFMPCSLVESFLSLSMLQNGRKGNWYFVGRCFALRRRSIPRLRTRYFSFCLRRQGGFALRRDLLLPMAAILCCGAQNSCASYGGYISFCLRRPHFFQQRKKWGKERRQKLRFCISSARYARRKSDAALRTFAQIFLFRSVKGLSQQQRRCR